MSSLILNELYPTVNKNLKNPSNVKMIVEGMSKFIDFNSEKLNAIGPMHMIGFSESDRNTLYVATGLTPSVVKDVLNKSPDIKSQWQIMNDPFNTVVALCIRYGVVNKNKQLTDISLSYLALSMYPSLFYKYFKFEPNENIMNYTINELTNKFTLKKHGNLFTALMATSETCLENSRNRLIKGTDKDFIYFIQDEKTRLNMFMRNIAIPFYENKKNDRYINIDKSEFDDGNAKDVDSNLSQVEKITNDIVLKLITSGVDVRHIQLASKYCKVSSFELRRYIEACIVNDKVEDIKTIVSDMIYIFLCTNMHTVTELNSNEFLLEMMKCYKSVNSNDKNLLEIKDIISRWLDENGIQRKTNRVATILSFRKAVYMYFVVVIQSN